MKVTNPESWSTQLKIYMSPYLAKRLLFALKDGVNSFEDNYGMINIPAKEKLNEEKKKINDKTEVVR